MPVPVYLLAATVAVSAVHAALPSHWLPFVLVGRARRWPARRVLGAAALAALLHVGSTVLLGVAAAAGAHAAFERLGALAERGAGVVLVAAGLWLATRREHEHVHAECPDDPAAGAAPGGSDRAVLAGLVGMLMISPCEAVVPLFFVAGGHPLAAVTVVAGVFAVSTLALNLLLVGLAWTGLARVHFHSFERREGLVNGLLLIGLGTAVLVGVG